MRQGRPYRHYGKTFDAVQRDHSCFVERSAFVCAYTGSEMIGLLKVVFRGEVASILQLLTKASCYDKRPANALLAKAVELCAEKGMLYLTYGMFNYGNKPDNPLREFKSRNGFQEILVPRFYVPLTGWGALCIKLKLQRGLLGVLPQRVIKIGLSSRATWYNLNRLLKNYS